MASSSDEEFLLLETSMALKLLNGEKKQGVHKINKERATFGEYHHLFAQLKQDPGRFHAYTRMSMDAFQYILNKVEHRLLKNWNNWHRPIFPEERLVVTLRYLATGSSFISLAFKFRMGASTVAAIVTETVRILWEELQPQHMPEPTEDSFKEIAKDFLDIWNFPNCIGAIDGKHVRVRCPSNSGSMYFNYKKYHSIVLQAVADARYRFIAIDVGGYGKQSDGGTFQASDLYSAIEGNILKVPEPTTLRASNVVAPFVFLADEAYPLLPYLMKPYSGGNLPLEQECFNKRLSRARKSVECAFGILTSKWRILVKSVETNESLVDDIIKCVCILHNTVIDKDGMQMNLTEVSCRRQGLVWDRAGRHSTGAKTVRGIFTAYFQSNPLSFSE